MAQKNSQNGAPVSQKSGPLPFGTPITTMSGVNTTPDDLDGRREEGIANTPRRRENFLPRGVFPLIG